MKNIKYNLWLYIDSTIKSYSAIFFSNSRFLAVLLLIVSFFDYQAGLSGLISVFVCNLFAIRMGFDRNAAKEGIYGYNGLLVGLSLGYTFNLSWILLVVIVISGILTFFLTITLEGILRKYSLPFLSLPFMLAVWLIMPATWHFGQLGLNEKGIFITNELYAAGGIELVNIYKDFNNLPIPETLKIYFNSLGAIFFQQNLISGIIISFGLLCVSRISFSLSFIGFYSAYFFYQLTGTNLISAGYDFIGYNFILTSIAVGGFFVIPSVKSYLWAVLILPVVVVFSLGGAEIFSAFHLPVLTLPFNFAVIMLLYVLKMRIVPSKNLNQTIYQLNSPEKNLYFFQNSGYRFRSDAYIPISLPFWGEWKVTQAHNDTQTHKGDWQFAWDFELTDENGQTFINDGRNLTDYICYEKLICAPADGYIVEITDGIEDNSIGDINVNKNWGNSIVIKHADFLYTQISHIKSGSFKVWKNTYVKKGEILANVGNSGYSPYPHIHFQIQATPDIGSKTLKYPIASHITKNTGNKYSMNFLEFPKKYDTVSNLYSSPVIASAMHLIPGRKIRLKISEGKNTYPETWQIFQDSFNNTYFENIKTGSKAYFRNDGNIFTFKNYIGNKKDNLFLFFTGLLKMPIAFYPQMQITDRLPLHFFAPKILLFFQDFIAAFFTFIKSEYTISCKTIDDYMSPKDIVYEAVIHNKIFNITFSEIRYTISFNDKSISKISILKNRKIKEIIWLND